MAEAHSRALRALDDGGYGVTPSQLVVFRYLVRHPDGAGLSEMAAAAGVAKQSMAYLVAQLLAQSLVSKADDPSDGRVQRIRLTEDGYRALSFVYTAQAELEGEWVKRAGERRIGALRQALEAVAPTSALDGGEGPAVRIVLAAARHP